MQNKEISNENIYTFLANSQKVTKRAVRLSEEQNLEKFEREAMGSLMAACGYSFDGLLNYLVDFPRVFDFEENVKKLKVMDDLAGILGGSLKTKITHDSRNYKAVAGFLTKYFENYTNEYNGTLKFDITKEYGVLGELIVDVVCNSIDLLSTEYEPSNKMEIPIRIENNFYKFDINKIIESIKKNFSDYYEVDNKKILHEIKQTVTVVENRDIENYIYKMMFEKTTFKNEMFLNYLELSYSDKVIIRPTEFIENKIQDSHTYYYINGIEYISNQNVEYIERNFEAVDYFYKVAKSLGIENERVIQKNYEEGQKKRSKWEDLKREKIDEQDLEDEKDYISSSTYAHKYNMKYFILNHISNGLNEAFRRAEENVEFYRPYFKTIKKIVLAKKWENIEENKYQRIVEI